MTIIQHAVWLYHRFPLIYRDVQELLHQRGIVVGHETVREWCIKSGPLFAEGLRHRESRQGSRWPLDEVCTMVNGVRHWLWRGVDEHGFVQGILLQRHRDTDAAKTFLTRLLGEYDVPEVIHTDQLRRYQAAIRDLPSLDLDSSGGNEPKNSYACMPGSRTFPTTPAPAFLPRLEKAISRTRSRCGQRSRAGVV